MFTDLALVLDDKFIVGSHNDGFVSVCNLETATSTVVERPFGECENIWGVKV